MTAYWKHFIRIGMGLVIFIFLILLSVASSSVSAAPGFTMPTPNATQSSWVILDLPANATQLRRGAEVYRLVCSPCHAYDGTGLTDQWRATWGEKDQNCWQSKCHTSNHPEEGFILPASPPVVGPSLPARFKTAGDLYHFIKIYMPWYNPNSLADEKAWAVAAYVMKLNRMSPPDDLNPLNADKIALFSAVSIDPAFKLSIPPGSQKKQQASSPPSASETQKNSSVDLLAVWVMLAVGAIIVIVILSAAFFSKKR